MIFMASRANMAKPGSDNVISNIMVDLLIVDVFFVKLKTIQLQNVICLIINQNQLAHF